MERVKLSTLEVGDKFTVLNSDHEAVSTILQKDHMGIRASSTAYEFTITEDPLVYKVDLVSDVKSKTIEDIEYIGIKLIDEDLVKLKDIIFCDDKTTADHVTLIHRSQFKDYPNRFNELLLLSSPLAACQIKIRITHIGWNDKCIAFRVEFKNSNEFCTNIKPHITLRTHDGGSSKDSNSIKNWIGLEEFEVRGVIFRKYIIKE